jgi:NADH-quinone oxidoreductase subunit J
VNVFFLAQAAESPIPSALANTTQSALDRVGEVDWHLLAYFCIAAATLGYYLLQRGLLGSRSIATIGGVLLAAAGLLAVFSQRLDFEKTVMFTFCGLTVAGGVAFLTARQPVHAALGFATAVLSGAGVLFMQAALFVAAATIIVYAGATIIVFLFVLMFSQQLSLETYELKLNRPLLAALVGGGLLAVLVYGLQAVEGLPTPEPSVSSATRAMSQATAASLPNRTAELGRSMFTDYLFTVEIAGTILLAATIGAIAVAQRTLEVD